MPPRFTSFDEAWRWFEGGGEVVPVARQREQLMAGRAQLLVFQARITDRRVLATVDECLAALVDVEDVVPMQLEQLHISIRAVGFQVIERRRDDEVLRQDVGSIGQRAEDLIRRAPPARVEVGPLNVFPDALILEVHDESNALAALRRRLAEVVGADAFGLDDTQYLPHVTIGWFGSASAGAALRERLPSLREEVEPVETLVRNVELARWWFTGIEDIEEPELDTVRGYALRG